MDAAPGRLPARRRQSRTDQHRLGALQQHRPLRLRAHDPGGTADRRDGPDRGLRLAPAARQRDPGLRRRDAPRIAAGHGGGDRHRLRRPLQRNPDEPPAADEDGRRRRRLRNQEGGRAVALRDREFRVQPRRSEPQHPDPAAAVLDLDRLPERRDPGDQRPQPRIPGQVRPRQLHADRRHRLLDLAGESAAPA